LRTHDDAVFRELTHAYRSELLVHCYRIVGSVQDAEDLVQETLLAAWRALDRFEGRGLTGSHAQPERRRLESGVREIKGGDMAVGVLTAAPDFTKEIYDQVTEKMFGHSAPIREDEAPEGLIVHSAGQGQQGYYVYDIWESREAFERFMEEKLGPALAEVMGGPPPESGAPQYFPIDVLVIPH
jgi:hypothetical protein